MRIVRAGVAAFLFAVVALVVAPGASAQTYTGVPAPSAGAVLGTSAVLGQADPVGQVLSAQVSVPTPATPAAQAPLGNLAVTGTDVIALAVGAVALILLGALLTRGARAGGRQNT